MMRFIPPPSHQGADDIHMRRGDHDAGTDESLRLLASFRRLNGSFYRGNLAGYDDKRLTTHAATQANFNQLHVRRFHGGICRAD